MHINPQEGSEILKCHTMVKKNTNTVNLGEKKSLLSLEGEKLDKKKNGNGKLILNNYGNPYVINAQHSGM